MFTLQILWELSTVIGSKTTSWQHMHITSTFSKKACKDYPKQNKLLNTKIKYINEKK